MHISSYLTNRKQRVLVNESISDFCTVNTGVPQGTVLGPLLFLLYVNDLLSGMPSDTILSFADDTAVISTDRTWTRVEAKMNEYLELVQNWLALNRLSLNIDKTVVMTFGSYSNSVPIDIDISINGKLLKRVECHRYLGIIFDYRMRWDKHVEYLLNKTRYLLFVFRKLSNYMITDTLRMLYYAFFHSIISYGIIAWGGVYSNYLNLLQSFQNKLLKIVNKDRFIIDKNPLNIRQMFSLESILFHYKILKDQYITSGSVTRKKSILIPQRCKTLSIKNSYISAISVYNVLPNDLKNITNVKSLKSMLKKWIIANI